MKKRRRILFLIDSLCFLAVCGVMLFVLFGEEYNKNTALEIKIMHVFFIYLLLAASRLTFSAYHRVWRYAGYNDYFRLVFSDTVAGLIYAVINRIVFTLPVINNLFDQSPVLNFLQIFSIFTANCILCLVMRFLYQHVRESENKVKNDPNKINIAIVGAGSVGVLLAKDLISNKYSRYKPVYFIDTDDSKVGNTILDIPIIAEDENIDKKIKELPVQEIVIALPMLTREQKAQKYNLYQKTGLTVKLYDYPLESSVGEKRTLRDVRIEDLLFRSTIECISDESRNFYTGKTVMITGGGGSIGSELCRQIAKTSPKSLIILDIYENNAYDIQQSLMHIYGKKLDLHIEIASIRDAEKIDEIFSIYKPQIVFHAAAHKHVPLMEDCPGEAIKNNVVGTYNLTEAAEKYGVEKFIMISTDKAVNPTNVMGATKRLCEMIIQSKKDSKTDFAAVRFGNVLGSNGSVIPLFRKQIESGGPVTITDRRIIRYFMTIPEAAMLVLEAGAMAAKSEIYVLDMGNPVKIIDLAENMIKLSGLTPYVDIDIEEIGLRPGEKLYEELLIKSEELDKTVNSLIFIERDSCPSREELEEKIKYLSEAVSTHDNETIRKSLMKVVPTYHTAEEVNKTALKSMEMKLAEEKKCSSI